MFDKGALDATCDKGALDTTCDKGALDTTCDNGALDTTCDKGALDATCDKGALDTTCDKVFQWLATGWWFSPSTLVSSTNKTDRQDITEILLKVALNTITPTLISWY